ncbi:MAG: NUMOD3 domain-containing DNA-binding protein [Nitrososphaeraceae archaeon]|nr:NUMOD3 domain-containing DNA-binding protein [Nitrososphaeraceae archaeon]
MTYQKNNLSTNAEHLISGLNSNSNNRYLKWYWQLIFKACLRAEKLNYWNLSQRQKWNDGYDEHHIIPKSKEFKGLDIPENIVLLTPKEHYIAHLLLYKIFPDSRAMRYAFTTYCEAPHHNQKWKNSRQYEEARLNYPKLDNKAKQIISSKAIKRHKEQGHPWIGRKHTEESKQKNSKTHKELGLDRRGNNGNANKELWNRYSEIKEIWINNNKPGSKRLSTIMNKEYSFSQLNHIVKAFREDDDIV